MGNKSNARWKHGGTGINEKHLGEKFAETICTCITMIWSGTYKGYDVNSLTPTYIMEECRKLDLASKKIVDS